MKTAQVMVVSDEEHLSPPSCSLDVRGDEPEDVVVPHQDCLVDLCLPEPARLLCGEEHLDRDSFSSPSNNRIMKKKSQILCNAQKNK